MRLNSLKVITIPALILGTMLTPLGSASAQSELQTINSATSAIVGSGTSFHVAASLQGGHKFSGRRGNFRGGRGFRGNRGFRGGRGHFRGGRGFRGRGFRGRSFRGRGFHNRGFRGNGFRGRRFARGGFYGPRYHSGFGFRKGYYNGGFYHRGFGVSDAFLVSAGVLGGAILIDNAIDNRRGSVRSLGPSLPVQRAPQRGVQRGQGQPEVLIGSLEGNFQPAYDLCVSALQDEFEVRGVDVSIPATPQSGGAMGDGWRFNAEFTTRDDRGASFLRTLTCEATETSVSYLEIG